MENSGPSHRAVDCRPLKRVQRRPLCQAVSTPPQSSNRTQACSASRDGIASQVREVIYNRGGPAFLSFPLTSCHATTQHGRGMVLWLLSAHSRLIQVVVSTVFLCCVFGLCAITSRAECLASGPCGYPLFPAAKTWAQVLLHEIWNSPYCLFPASSSAVIVCRVSDHSHSAFCEVIPSWGFNWYF